MLAVTAGRQGAATHCVSLPPSSTPLPHHCRSVRCHGAPSPHCCEHPSAVSATPMPATWTPLPAWAPACLLGHLPTCVRSKHYHQRSRAGPYPEPLAHVNHHYRYEHAAAAATPPTAAARPPTAAAATPAKPPCPTPKAPAVMSINSATQATQRRRHTHTHTHPTTASQ